MLTTLQQILADARERAYAVPAFDCVEDVMVRTVLETAEELRAPVIIMCLAPRPDSHDMAYLAGLVRGVADAHPIPVGLHLDHTSDLDLVKKAIDHGFTSVMVDGSTRPFEKNVALTRAAVELAHPHGVGVEAELGHVGGMDLAETECGQSVLTLPEEVVRFVAETEVDALAVSIGTAHGVYRSLPTLSIDRLKELHAVSTVPLVLHGGSGTPDDQIQESVRNGICKINIFADNRIAMAKGFKRAAEGIQRIDPLPGDLFGPIKRAMSETVAEKIRLLFADGKA
ncbi:MAG: class II fructose-bisphosphate aldolase [Planctomycetaceae bacterium]|nr:class II fructose-bisphosphate aldolase [Planctomycetaceae bacterium]